MTTQELVKRDNENYYQYLWRLGELLQIYPELNWSFITPYINRSLFKNDTSLYRDESAYRKLIKGARDFYEAGVFDLAKDREPDDIDMRRRALEEAKIQYRDERAAWNKSNYANARVSQKLDYLEGQLSSMGRLLFPGQGVPEIASGRDTLVVLSDFHIGECFASTFGDYNSDIAKDRLNRLLDKVIDIQTIHNCENCYIVLAGDFISGSIHKALQVQNRENVIDQIKIATELTGSFCYALSGYFNNIYLTDVVGNHSRIDRKEDAIHDDRLDRLISWGVKMMLSHIPNFEVLENRLDVGIAKLDIRGKIYVAVHGDYDKFNKSGVSNLCMMIGQIPYAVISGHLHTCALEEFNGVKAIRGGCLGGSGGSYTIEKRLMGDPAQMVCVCDDSGLICCYPVNLK